MKDKHCFQVELAEDGLIMIRVEGPTNEDGLFVMGLTHVQADSLINDMLDAMGAKGKQRYPWITPRLVGGER